MLGYVDGTVTPLADARVPLSDRGFLLGDGVFETMRTGPGGIFEAALHRERMAEGLRRLGISADLGGYDDAVDALIDAGRDAIGERMTIRIQASTGDMHDLTSIGEIRFTGIAKPLPPSTRTEVRLVTAPHIIRRDDPMCGTKTLSFLPYVMARRHALAAGADDALLRNDAGAAVEGSTANLFVQVDGRLYAPGPKEGVVDGVTRRVLLRHVDAIEEAPPEGTWEAAWLTSSIAGVVSVTELDGVPVPISPEAKRLRDLYHSIV